MLEQIPDQTTESLPPIVDGNLRGADERYAQLQISTTEQEASLEQDVRSMLAESLKAVAEEGPDKLASYMSNVLADTTGKATRAERQALFTMLAEGQKSELYKTITETGVNVTSFMQGTDRLHTKSINESAMAIRRRGAEVLETHKETVGRAVSRGADVRSLTRSHDVAGQSARSYGEAARDLPAKTQQWEAEQAQHLGQLKRSLDTTSGHMRVLQEAKSTLKPDYEGKTKDLSSVINEKVMTDVAARLQEALHQDSTGQAMVEVINTITSQATDEQQLTKVYTVVNTFAANYGNLLRATNAKAVNYTGQITQRVSQFITRGQQYAYARRPDEAVGMYQQQNRLLTETVGASEQLGGTTQQALRASGQTLEQVQAVLRGLNQQ